MVAGYLSLFLLLLAFRYAMLRAVPPLRRYLDAGPWGDALAYFLQIQYYRHHSGVEPDSRCLFRGNNLHTPSWYHKFALSWCSDATLWSKPWLPNLALYAIGVACLLLLSSGALTGAAPAGYLLLVTLFLAQVDNSLFDERTVHYLTIQPRLLGLISLSLHAALFAVMPSPVIVIVAGSAAVLVALTTSVFSRQVACFVLPLAALLSWNVIPLLNLVLATLLSLILNRSEFIASAAAHWRYAVWYFRNFHATRPGSGLSYLLRRTFAPPIVYLPRYLDSVLAVVLLSLVLRHGTDPFARRAIAMIGAALIVCAATALRKLASLGECWRYVSFTCWILTPIAIVHAVLELHINLWVVCFLALMLLLRNLYLSLTPGEQLSNPNAEVAGLLQRACSNLAKPPVWWSAHFRYGSIAVALNYGASTFEIQGTDLSEQVMATMFARYPYLHCSEAFFDAHRVTHLLISKSEWPEELYGSIERIMRMHRVLADSPRFVILARACA
jgi:hypothetical protein